jgi:phage terminase large subunit
MSTGPKIVKVKTRGYVPRPVTFEVYPEQGDFIGDQSRYPSFVGGRGSGKTIAGAIKSLTRIGPSTVGIIAAPTFPMLEQAAKPALLALLEQAKRYDPRFHYVQKRAENKLLFPYLKAEIHFCTLDNYDRVRGINATWGWVDEAPYIAFDAWKAIQACVRIIKNGLQPQLFVTGTPKGRNWFWVEWIQKTLADFTNRRKKRYTIHKASSRANPYLYKDFIEDLGYEGRYAQQEIDGDFITYEGLVYPIFSRETMVYRSKEVAMEGDQIPVIDTKGWYSILTADIGTRNPTAILTLRVSPSKEAIHVHREFYQRGLSSSGIITAYTEAYREEQKFNKDISIAVLDPSAAGYIADLQNAGLNVIGANNSLTEGIGRVTTFLERGFTIDPTCVNTMLEFDSYGYPSSGNIITADKPAKVFDHAMDALRYGAMAIDDIVLGNWVLN